MNSKGIDGRQMARPPHSRVISLLFPFALPSMLINRIKGSVFTKLEDCVVQTAISSLPTDLAEVMTSQVLEINDSSHVEYDSDSETVFFKMAFFSIIMSRKRYFPFRERFVRFCRVLLRVQGGGEAFYADLVSVDGCFSMIEFSRRTKDISKSSDVEVLSVDLSHKELN